jgi:hypothetical protein
MNQNCGDTFIPLQIFDFSGPQKKKENKDDKSNGDAFSKLAAVNE